MYIAFAAAAAAAVIHHHHHHRHSHPKLTYLSYLSPLRCLNFLKSTFSLYTMMELATKLLTMMAIGLLIPISLLILVDFVIYLYRHGKSAISGKTLKTE